MKSIKDQILKPNRDSQPWAMWHWNLHLDQTALLEHLVWFSQTGFGGVLIRPSREMDPAYCSDEFFTLFGNILEKAHELKIGVRIADDFSLSWSGCFTGVLSQYPKMRLHRLRLIENRMISNRQEVVIKTDVQKSIIIALNEVNGVLEPSSIQEIECTGCTDQVRWQVPDGAWRVLVFVKECHTDIAGGYLPNVFSHATAEWYIQNVLAPYAGRFTGATGGCMEGFVTELPALFHEKNTIPWDDELVGRFRSKTKKNLVKMLPALFCDAFPGAQKNRHQVYAFMFDTLYERFVAPLDEWAKENRSAQWLLCPDTLPGAGGYGIIDGYFAGTVACAASGYQNISGGSELHAGLRMMADINTHQFKRETITVLGRNRSGNGATLQSLKSDLDRTLLAGASRVIVDGFYCSIDQRSYYKSAFSPGTTTPEGSYLHHFCRYAARMNELLKTVHWNRQVAVLAPVAEIMASHNPAAVTIAGVYERLEKTCAALERNGLGFDIVTSQFLSECTIRANGEFAANDRVRKGAYQALLIPYAPDLSRDVLIFMEKLVQKEGCVLFVDALPHGTIEDGVSSTMTGRFEKIVAERHKTTGILSLDSPEDALESIVPALTIVQNGKVGGDVASAFGTRDGHDCYLFYNYSEVKDQPVAVEMADSPCFMAIDVEQGAIDEVTPEERVNNSARFQLSVPPKALIMMFGLSQNPGNGKSDAAHKTATVFMFPERSYRILVKDQWTFVARSLNVFPLTAWNVRIGLSRESGGFSHFYETHFQAKNLPSICFVAVSTSGFLYRKTSSANPDAGELTINGTRVEKNTFVTGEHSAVTSGSPEPVAAEFDTSVLSLLQSSSLIYTIKDQLLRGDNRLSLRTTGLVTDPGTLHYPPLLIGDFSVIKGQTGGMIDKIAEVPAQNSWVKHGFPYLCGKGEYRQSVELPDGYKRLVLCFPYVSGVISVSVNNIDCGTYLWQPMQVDITHACTQKRIDIIVTVVNSIDTLVRMNGRPSGIIGDVYLDVY